jgi:hypothetical protein
LSDIPLLPLEDSRWATYRGGYNGILYNAVPIIRRLQREGATNEFWEHVWAELHHQGDVGEATYALVPYLVDYQSRQRELDEQLFHFCVLVDLQQPENNNPAIRRNSNSRTCERCEHSRSLARSDSSGDQPSTWSWASQRPLRLRRVTEFSRGRISSLAVMTPCRT